MKKLITDYTFDPAVRTVKLNGYAVVDLRGLIIITNVTDNIIIYSYADIESPYSLGKATAATNVFTLGYDTTKMSASDNLQIYYDDVVGDENWKDQRFDYDISNKLIYRGVNIGHDAAVAGTDWFVWKFTYVGENVTRIEGPLVGSWTGRASIAWGA